MKMGFILFLLLIIKSTYSPAAGLNGQDSIPSHIPSSSCFIFNPKPENQILFRTTCSATRTKASSPLVVIDGIITENEKLANFNPDDIISITILKETAACALYGYRAASGVIIIETKQAQNKRFVVEDIFDGRAIPGTTISFVSSVSRKDTLVFVANDTGAVTSDKIKKGRQYEVTVSSIGYKTQHQILKIDSNRDQKIFLERDIKNCAEVVVTTQAFGRCCRCGCTASCVIIKSIKLPTPKNDLINLKTYPNPSQRGRKVNIEFNCDKDNDLNMRILSQDGKLLLGKSIRVSQGINVVQVDIDDRWIAGVYFIQLTNKSSKLVDQDKIVIY